LYGGFIGSESQPARHEHHLPGGVIVSTTKTPGPTVITSAYIAVFLAVLVWGPLIALHGYRQWWVVLFYAVIACATIGGLISHHRIAGRNGKS
jgi:hypothetical protein